MSIFGRFSWIRGLAKVLARSAGIGTESLDPSVLETGDSEQVVTLLQQDGLCLGINLTPDLRQEILEFAQTTTCYGNLDPDCGFLYAEKQEAERSADRTFFTAQYFNTSLDCPAIQRLSHDPKLLEIAGGYLRGEPKFTGSRLWWNFVVGDDQPYDSNKTITFFHYDLDDYACMRFFFYLTPVTALDGPHVCVRGSHRRKRWSYLLSPVKRRSDQEIIDYYQMENVVTICGEPGFGFAEDTFCYHKATRPRHQDRLMLQIQFALHDYGLHHDRKQPNLLYRINDAQPDQNSSDRVSRTAA